MFLEFVIYLLFEFCYLYFRKFVFLMNIYITLFSISFL